MEATVSEIHAYPLRPAGYAEPLFHTTESRREILDHLAQSGWLWRASEAPRPDRHSREHPEGHSKESSKGDARGATDTRAGRLLASWREVDRWWEPCGGVDHVCYLVERPGGAEEVLDRASRAA